MREATVLAKNFINLFYPLHCLICGGRLDALNEFHLCGRCVASIQRNAMPPFELETPSVMAYSACLYEGTMKEVIHSFKYKGKLALVKISATLMIDYIRENPEIADAGVITAVPLHKKRLEEREFNQSLLLARGIARAFNLPVKNILEKKRRTKYQNELSRGERLVNLKNAFSLRGREDISGQDILLVDDVMTTGATLNECAKTLLNGGARNVTCFTLARGI